MLNILRARWQQKHRTMKYPDGDAPSLPTRFRGHPVIDQEKCLAGCKECISACPTGAIDLKDKLELDLGKCLFCTDCADACPQNLIQYSQDYRLAVRDRKALLLPESVRVKTLQGALDSKLKKLFGRSLKLRQVSAGGCNACESDTNVLGTVAWDLGRFGIQFVASPRHADGLLITGPVTKNMELALMKTYAAVAEPKIVICVGSCAISGGPFIDHPDANNGADRLLPVNLYIPGCPPHPLTILEGLLRMLGRIEEGKLESK